MILRMKSDVQLLGLRPELFPAMLIASLYLQEQDVEEEDEMVPHLKVHFPTERTDSAHGVRKSVDS